MNDRDYIAFDPLPTTLPKSTTKPSRERRENRSSKSEEIMVVGAGRNNRGLSKELLAKKSATLATERVRVPEDTSSNSISPELPGRNKAMQKRSDSLPDTVEYDKVAPDIINDAFPPYLDDEHYLRPIFRSTENNPSFHTSSLDRSERSPFSAPLHIYNVLRSEDKMDPNGDYHRLNRSNGIVCSKQESAAPKADANREETTENGGEMFAEETTPEIVGVDQQLPIDIDDDYVKDFQILKNRLPSNDGHAQVSAESFTERDFSLATDEKGNQREREHKLGKENQNPEEKKANMEKEAGDNDIELNNGKKTVLGY